MSPLRTFTPGNVTHEVTNEVHVENPHGEKHLKWAKVQTVSLWAIALLLLLIFLHGHGWAQSHEYPDWVKKELFQAGLNSQGAGSSTYPFYVICSGGCGGGGGGTSSNFGATFPTAGTAIGVANGGNMVSLNADGSGNLLINCSVNCYPATQPVSNAGTFAVQAAQSGTWNVANTGTFAVQAAQSGTWNIGTVTTLTGITNSVAVTGTFFQATQPVSAAALPLPSNAAQETGGNLATIAGAISSSVEQVNVKQLGGSAVYVDPCLVNTPIALPISEATSSTTNIITGTASKQTYICGIFLVAAAATNINLVEGTGTNCSSISAGLIGGSTAATGANLAANGGFVVFGGGYWVAKTATLADNICYIASAGNQVSGVIKYVQQ